MPLESTDRQAEAADSDSSSDRLLNVPNVLATIRLVGSLGILALAVADEPIALLVLFFALTATDWFDGKLAVWLGQRTTFGAHLDSAADVTMYVMTLVAAVWMRGEVLAAEWMWIAAAVGSYAAACAASLIKFHRLPSYHTRMAKAAWLFMVPAVVAFFLDWSLWPLRIAMLFVTVANLEAIAITVVLAQWQVDVISILHLARKRPSTAPESGD